MLRDAGVACNACNRYGRVARPGLRPRLEQRLPGRGAGHRGDRPVDRHALAVRAGGGRAGGDRPLAPRALAAADGARWSRMSGVGVLLFAVQFGGLYIGLADGMPAGTTALIACSAPLLVAVAGGGSWLGAAGPDPVGGRGAGRGRGGRDAGRPGRPAAERDGPAVDRARPGRAGRRHAAAADRQRDRRSGGAGQHRGRRGRGGARGVGAAARLAGHPAHRPGGRQLPVARRGRRRRRAVAAVRADRPARPERRHQPALRGAGGHRAGRLAGWLGTTGPADRGRPAWGWPRPGSWLSRRPRSRRELVGGAG